MDRVAWWTGAKLGQRTYHASHVRWRTVRLSKSLWLGARKTQMKNIGTSGHVSARRMVASTFGVLVGLAGIDHGVFEILQGNTKPDGFMIKAIGPAQRFWEYGTEPALTVVPNFLITGILAVMIGALVIVWATRFVHRKYGAGVLLLLAGLLFLVGGGFAPIFLTVLATLTATQINKPLTGWRTHIPAAIQTFLAWLWPGALLAFVTIFFISVEIAIFGYPFLWFWRADTTVSLLYNASYVMLGLMVLSPLTAFAYDTKCRMNATG